MKRTLLVLALLFSFQNIIAQTGQHDITVNISNIDVIEGSLIIGLYDSEAKFLKKPLTGKLQKVTGNSASIVFKNVKAGDYAISLFHDENDNKKFDTYFLGIPKEDYGCSNNARGTMGPPSWNDAVFTINTKNVTQNINL
ncbi:DUF2141 domain-containing protein [Lacinutrix chionoecetis]